MSARSQFKNQGLIPINWRVWHVGHRGRREDAAVVAADADADADVAAAADAIAFGAMSNGGQTCVGIERVYVERAARDAHLTSSIAPLRPGSDAGASYGPMTMSERIDVVRRHATPTAAHERVHLRSPSLAGALVAPFHPPASRPLNRNCR